MKTKIYTTVSTIMLFIPWGLLFLRRYDWALQMPIAKILISGCAALMIAGGVFSVIVYAKGNVRHLWMQICMIIHMLYAAVGIAAFCMMAISD